MRLLQFVMNALVMSHSGRAELDPEPRATSTSLALGSGSTALRASGRNDSRFVFEMVSQCPAP